MQIYQRILLFRSFHGYEETELWAGVEVFLPKDLSRNLTAAFILIITENSKADRNRKAFIHPLQT